jgi:integrase
MARLRVHLVPFFGPMGLSEVTPAKIQEYRIHRHEQAMAARGKPPARSTLHQEIVVLRQTLKTAVRQGWLKYLPDLSAPYKSNGKIAHRAWFSPDEYRQLYEATRKRAQHPRNPRYKWESGKRGVGYCKSMPGAVRPFERLRTRNNPKPTDLIFPKTHREMFNTILEEEGLKKDREGQPRTAYSLRHTYICLRLLEGADIYQIAKNCRTSVEMIEKFYASHIKTNLDAAAINIMRNKKAGTNRRKPNEPRP